MDHDGREPYELRMALLRGVSTGSGYAVSANTLLTADHVAGPIGTTCSVRPEIGGEHQGVVVWSGEPFGYDAALVVVPGDPWRDIDTEVVWGELRGAHVMCLTFGYPWVDVEHAKRTLSGDRWVVPVATHRELGSYKLLLPDAAPRERAPKEDKPEVRPSAWAGLSGGPLLSSDGTCLLGVVRGAKENYSESALGAVRARNLLQNSGFATLVRASVDDLRPVPTTTAAATPPTGTEPSGMDGLKVNRIPVGWRPDGRPCPVDDAAVADLGSWVCLRRGASTSVLAAAPGIDVTPTLDRVETGPVRRGEADVIPRRWYRVDPRTTLPDQEHELIRLRERTSPGTAGAGVGMVLDWEPDEAFAHSARECRNRIRSLAPRAALVFVVSDELPVDAVASACALARELGTGQGAEQVEVFARLWFAGVSTDHDSGPPPVLGGEVAHRLMAGVGVALARRNLPTRDLLTGDDPLPVGVSAAAVAAAVVDELNKSQPWGDVLRESMALTMVRDYQPDYFPALVEHHAARRTPPHHWASLHAARTLDRHVDRWLRAAAVVGAPDRVPAVLRRAELVDAVLLGMIRLGGEHPDWQSWADYATQRRTPAGDLAKWHAAADGSDVASFLGMAEAPLGHVVHRAGLVVPRAAAVGSAAWWAFLGRAPVDGETIAWLKGLGVTARRVAGFTDDPVEPDPDLAELLLQLRTAMRPPLHPWEATP